MREWVLLQTGAVCLGFAIDFIVGDPHCLPHPVRWMGALIAALERRLRRGKSPRSDFWRGLLLMVVTALLSAIGASKNARRAAFVHFYFNIIGTAIFMVLFYGINAVVGFSFMGESAGAAGIAIIHSCFNVTATVVLLPFRDILVKIATLTVRDNKAEVERSGLKLLDERFLEKPSFALN